MINQKKKKRTFEKEKSIKEKGGPINSITPSN